MVISELVQKLRDIHLTHGDLPVVTPGFDESDFDDVAAPKVIFVTPPLRPPGHMGTRKECPPETSGAVKAALLTF